MYRGTLTHAINKLAMDGERAGFRVEQMIQLLNDGLHVETLIEVIAWRLGALGTSAPQVMSCD